MKSANASGLGRGCAGRARALTLSVADAVGHLSGRRFGQTPSSERLLERRWYEAFGAPGQCVSLGPWAGDGAGAAAVAAAGARAREVCTIATSPYMVRQESAFLDASMIEVLVAEAGAGAGGSSEDDWRQELWHAQPGDVVSCSDVQGRGFTSLLNPDVNLESSMREGLGILIACTGPQGLGAARSLATWPPLQAHALKHPCRILCHATSREAALMVHEWDTWRANGIEVVPCYGEAALDSLSLSLFDAPGGAGAAPGGGLDGAVFISGLGGKSSAALVRALHDHGVSSHRILFNEAS